MPNASGFSKKHVWLWGLYDFANSLGLIVLVLYFGPWFIGDLGGSDVQISIAVALATLLLLCVLPFLGHIADRTHKRMPFMVLFTFIASAALIALGILGGGEAPSRLTIISLYFVFQFAYQASLGFYSAFLRELSENTYSPERVSGIGIWMGQLGNILTLALALTLINKNIPVFGVTGRPAIFVMGGVLFFVFALPVFLFLRDPKKTQTERLGFGKTIGNTLRDLKNIRQHKGVLPYLISYYLYADAVLTLTLFVTTYLDLVGHIDDQWKNIALMGSILTGMAGALGIPLFVRLIGSRKRALSFFLGFWALLLAGVAVATAQWAYVVLILLNGFAYAVLFGLSRSFYALLVPKEKQTELFSIYILFERGASILGPLVWSGVAILFSSYGDDRYRFSVFTLALIVALSMYVLRFVQEPENRR